MRRLLTLLVAVLLAACAGLPGATFEPNPNLVLQGIPPIPQALVDRVARYTDFRGHVLADWHPVRREMVVAHRKAGDTLVQLYRLAGPMAPLEQLTFDEEPVYSASYEPREGRYLVFPRSRGGNEASQLYRLDLDTRRTTLLTDPDQRHARPVWLNRGAGIVYMSLPLDRTAAGGTRSQVQTTLWLQDPMEPASRRRVADLPGGEWIAVDVSPDDRQLLLTRQMSITESEIWLLDLADGRRRRLLPAEGAPRAADLAREFSPDGRSVYFTSDRDGEFAALSRLDLATGAVAGITAGVPWDVSGAGASQDGRWVAALLNVEGRTELRAFDAGSLAPVVLGGLPAGSVGAALFHRRRNELAIAVNGAQGPSQVHAVDLGSGRVEAWTRAEAAPGLDMSAFREQEIVRWTSFDGRSISGLLSRPPARFSGRRPVLVNIHGGPEEQARIGFLGRMQFYVQELGMAVIRPNVRGSSGFGKTFLGLDDGMKREDSVKDIGALLDWIAAQPDLDPKRVVVTGGSYGGYMSLAVAVHYSDRIAGAIDNVGISHFVSFLQKTESYRRDLRRVEYGDERDPAMREFLHRISPLTQAHRIRTPLFVAHGRNDPRVPYTEAEQIVERVRANGTPVWYLRAENEGHGFARKENADFHFYVGVRFIETVLGL